MGFPIGGDPRGWWCSGGDGLAGLLLGERAAEGLLEFGCGGIVWVEREDGVQLFEVGVKLLRQAGRRIVGGAKLGNGGRSVGLAGPDFASRLIAQDGLRVCSGWSRGAEGWMRWREGGLPCLCYH